MKYRQHPEDFIVEEIADHKIQQKGKYKLYTLEKEDIETMSLLDTISTFLNVPKMEIGIAGIKDTHAKTKQYITVPQKYELKTVKSIKVEFIGYVNQPLQLGDLKANKFIITVREIEDDQIDQVWENAKSVEDGVPNYYDTQRFGSVVDNKFVGKYLIKKDYEAAVKHYLTASYKSDSEQRINDKENIFHSWPEFNRTIESHDLRKVVLEYKHTKKWLRAYKYISQPLRLLFVSSYQSYLWNECIKLLLEEKVENKDLYVIPYVLGELVFNKVKVDSLPKTFQTISHRIKQLDYEEKIIDEVLNKEGITIPEFNIRQTGNFFKSQSRDIMLFPEDFYIHDPKRNGETYDVTVEFTLSKGCYATMVLKKIFGQ